MHTDSDRRRFWARVRKSASGCWEWTGGRRGGRPGAEYGAFSLGKRSIGAHRFAWEIEHGQIAVGLVVRHTCDNPKCVRIDHLQLGTNRDNIDDMLAKQRQRRGESHNNHRLTEAAVIEARRAYAEGESGVVDLALANGVGRATMGQAISGMTWKHLPMPDAEKMAAAARANHLKGTPRGDRHHARRAS